MPRIIENRTVVQMAKPELLLQSTKFRCLFLQTEMEARDENKYKVLAFEPSFPTLRLELLFHFISLFLYHPKVTHQMATFQLFNKWEI